MHKITDINLETMTGTCSICGEGTGIYARHARKDGSTGYACSVRRKERSKEYQIKVKYGITLNEFNELLAAQGGTCKLCKREVEEFCVDHDHKCCPGVKTCGQCLRGIICHLCNGFIGHIENNDLDLTTIQRYMDESRLYTALYPQA